MQLMQRRAFMITSAVAGIGYCRAVGAGDVPSGPARDPVLDPIRDSEWWPYRADTPVRIDPANAVPSPMESEFAPGYVKKLPQVSSPGAPIAGRRKRSAAAAVPGMYLPPKAYDVTGQKFNIDPWLIYGVALQESILKFGDHALPYPWTLCVAGASKRYGSYEATLSALRSYVQARGIRNIDCGAMQVNWRWHSDKLQSLERALDPYPNLAVGAQILRGHFERQGSWVRAVALYHTGSDKDSATIARGRRYSRGVFARLARMGLDTRQLLASKGWRRYAA